MSYTLYSRNRLLGETELEYHTESITHRMGAFDPTRFGETLMPVITGVQRLLHEHALRDESACDAADGAGIDDVFLGDMVAAESHLASLELELRAPDGSVVPTEWIGVQDTEELTRWAERMATKFPERYALEESGDDEIDAAVAHDMELIDSWIEERESGDGGWESDEPGGEFPRYQISVELKAL